MTMVTSLAMRSSHKNDRPRVFPQTPGPRVFPQTPGPRVFP